MKHLFVTLVLMSVMGVVDVLSCTSAIISGSVTENGRPLLWKHRDTSQQDNKVELIAATDSTFEYVALFNADDITCREAWIGYNSQGFAVMNTAVYNLKDDTVTHMDREGLVMTEALKRCSTVDEFEQLLIKLPKPLGVETNFGVIDADGNGAYFETDNYGYVKYDIADAPDGIMVRTNYAHSGRKGMGKGYTRELNALHFLMSGSSAKCISAEFLTETLSRQFYTATDNQDYTNGESEVVANQAFIPRYNSTATVVIEGVVAGENPLLTTMWVGLGFPPCSEISAVWLDDNGVPWKLRGTGDNGHSLQCDIVIARKNEVLKDENVIDLSKLYNSRGTGYCQKLIPLNKETYRRGYEEIATKRKQLNGVETHHD